MKHVNYCALRKLARCFSMRKVISFPDISVEEFSLLMKNFAFSINGETIMMRKGDRDFSHVARSIKVVRDSSPFPNCTKAPQEKTKSAFILPSVTNLSTKWLRSWLLRELNRENIYFSIIIWNPQCLTWKKIKRRIVLVLFFFFNQYM